ncbi:MAG: saccharopine dehydrogenase NADP-binding domain-containing protein [Bacteroidales bacterium]|nr:saccharopine dehydrogenase NADP-binding domain-containing protein [Bacteroidales bacterium]
MKVVVLGAGLVGGPMAIDLAKTKNFEISIVDKNENALDRIHEKFFISKTVCDLSKAENVKNIVKDFDIVVNAVPGFMGFSTLKSIIESKKNVIDIAFFPENLFELDDLAKQNNVIAISDIGVAPGMSNVLIGYVDNILDVTETAKIYVGGLPKIREWPYEYKAVFSPIDVIEEYTRPARYVENGVEIVRPALSDPELLNFSGIGTLEAFNSDGLRSLAKTINAKNMIEKTLRYKGHIDKMAVLRETGFFNKEPIEINGTMISPLEFTSKILFPKWKLNEGEEDITVMKVIVQGIKNGQKLSYEYNLFDTYDKKTKTHSMARTTGYTATTAVRMLAEGLYTRVGVSAPEFIGKNHKCVDFLLNGLKERGVIYKETIVRTPL